MDKDRFREFVHNQIIDVLAEAIMLCKRVGLDFEKAINEANALIEHTNDEEDT